MMNDCLKSARLRAAWGCALLALIGTACARKPTAVDPSYSSPEGVRDTAAHLMMWPEQQAVSLQYLDNSPFGPDPGDVLIGPLYYSRRTPGTRSGIILDGSLATNFEILRREPNGGLLKVHDFFLVPRERWPDGEGEMYEFLDEEAPAPTAEYIARGIVGGSPTASSPLSNTVAYTTPMIGAITLHFPTDTTVVWDPVPNASLYVAQVFQFVAATPQERVLASAAIPLYVGQSKDFFVGLSTQPDTVGRNRAFRGTVYTNRDLTPGEYFFRVTALDAAGNLIATTIGDSATVQGEGTYERYATGTAVIPRPVIEFGPARSRRR
jgi:hypothetical protein